MIKTFKGVNSQRVTIPGVVSIPPWHSPDKSALMLLIREGERNGRREVKGRAVSGKDGIGTARKQNSGLIGGIWDR